MPEVRLHYTTLGKPVKDAGGRTANAVPRPSAVREGNGRGLPLQPIFAGVLFGPEPVAGRDALFSSSFPTISVMGNPASPVTACAHFPNMTMRT